MNTQIKDKIEKNKEKIIIHGTGGTAQFYAEMDCDYEKFELIGFSDNNKQMWGTTFLNKPVYAPEQLNSIDFDVLIVASVFFEKIIQDLMKKGIPAKKIKNQFYGQEESIQRRYQKFYQKNGKRQKDKKHVTIKSGEKIVICTAITNGYDELKTPEFVDKQCDYICFTDNTEMQSDIWKIRKIPDSGLESNRSAKQIKVLAHRFLPEYDWSIWVDAKFRITGDLVELLNEYAVNSNFLSFMHYRRSDVFEDAEVIKQAGFEKVEIVDSMMQRYRKEGFTGENELLEGGVLWKKHNSPEIVRLMEAWWREITDYSRRDQLSFNYCAWKENVFCDMIDTNIYDNVYVKVYPHLKKKTILV